MRRKSIIGMLALIAATTFTTVSCRKAEQPVPAAGEKIDISIRGSLTDFVEADGTKASVQSIFRMIWDGGETVYAFGTNDGLNIVNLGTLTASVVSGSNGKEADLTGSITLPQAGTKITLMYSPEFTDTPTVTANEVLVDLSAQSGALDAVTFVAYATVDFDGEAASSYRTSFKFANNVLRVNVSGMEASKELASATITGMETTCKLVVKVYGSPEIYGVTSGNIVKTLPTEAPFASTNDKGRVAMYIAVPAYTANAARSLSVLETASHTFLYEKFATGSISDGGNMLNAITDVPYPISYVEYGVDLGIGTFIPETGVIWAPFNCGYDATDYPYGKLYQFGRKVGGGYASPEVRLTYTGPTWPDDGCNKHPADDKFYGYGAIYDWYTNTSELLLGVWPMTDPEGATGIGNPCPSGWRVPTRLEILNLVAGSTSGSYKVTLPSGLRNFRGQNGYWLDGTKTPAQDGSSGIFLQAAGYLTGDGSGLVRGSEGKYWASENSGNPWASFIQLKSNYAYENGECRVYGFSVRCVQDY